MKIIVTNNRKVQETYSSKAEIIFLDDASGLAVLKEGKKIASDGGSLLIDPTRNKGYYRSLPFFKNDKGVAEEKSLSLIEQGIKELEKQGDAANKEPILAGIHQKKDLDIVKKVIS